MSSLKITLAALSSIFTIATAVDADEHSLPTNLPQNVVTNANLDGVGSIVWLLKGGIQLQCGAHEDKGVEQQGGPAGKYFRFAFDPKGPGYWYEQGTGNNVDQVVQIMDTAVVIKMGRKHGKVTDEAQAAIFRSSLQLHRDNCLRMLGKVKAEFAGRTVRVPFGKVIPPSRADVIAGTVFLPPMALAPTPPQ